MICFLYFWPVMSSKKKKHYVVFIGHKPGIYATWDECQKQIKHFPGAQYKSFEDGMEAKSALAEFNKNKEKFAHGIVWDSICVDAACSGNPGDMEYRGVYTKNKQQLFLKGPFAEGTNNVGEFLAIVHGLAFLKSQNQPEMPIYSDSKTAIAWINNKKAKTLLELTTKNKILFELIDKAENWLNKNRITNPILKWDTKNWGEIPADFGRKG